MTVAGRRHHWQLADESPAEILNTLDAHSRPDAVSDASAATTGHDAVRNFRRASAARGSPPAC